MSRPTARFPTLLDEKLYSDITYNLDSPKDSASSSSASSSRAAGSATNALSNYLSKRIPSLEPPDIQNRSAKDLLERRHVTFASPLAHKSDGRMSAAPDSIGQQPPCEKAAPRRERHDAVR